MSNQEQAPQMLSTALTQPHTAAEPKGEAVLHVREVGKEYRLYDSARQRLRSVLTGKSLHRSHWALHDVSFTLHRGECLGVIGDNGAGKSTLLKLLAGALQPSKGRIECLGRITAILELGAGFHPDFSGRANLYFACSLIGITPQQMKTLEPEIAEFSELGEAMDWPVKTYSSGMAVRLAFALVTAIQPDVLIVDEALAVGDQSFQKKCIERILEFRRNGCTILFCSHSPYHIRHLCDSAVWLVKGRVQAQGATEPVLAAYEAAARAAENPSLQKGAVARAQAASVNASAAAHWRSVQLVGLQAGLDSEVPVVSGGDLLVALKARVPLEVVPSFGVMLEQLDGVGITSVAMHVEGAVPVRDAEGDWVAQLRFPSLPLRTGDYVLSAFLFDESGLMVMDEWLRFQPFRFVSDQPLPGLVSLPHQWELPDA